MKSLHTKRRYEVGCSLGSGPNDRDQVICMHVSLCMCSVLYRTVSNLLVYSTVSYSTINVVSASSISIIQSFWLRQNVHLPGEENYVFLCYIFILYPLSHGLTCCTLTHNLGYISRCLCHHLYSSIIAQASIHDARQDHNHPPYH